MSDIDSPVTGLVVRYNYLWARQFERGEESGRKARPACVAIPVGAQAGNVVLFPITTQYPSPDRIAIEVPEIERRRLKLSPTRQCWIILDEVNHDQLPGSYHLEPINLSPATYSYGTFSPAFMRVFLRTLAETLRVRRLRTVPRD